MIASPDAPFGIYWLVDGMYLHAGLTRAHMVSAGALHVSSASASSLDPDAIVDRVLAGGAAAGTQAEAQADLLSACLAQRPDAAPACGAAVLRLTGVDPRIAGAWVQLFIFFAHVAVHAGGA